MRIIKSAIQAMFCITTLVSMPIQAKEIIPLSGTWQFALGPSVKDIKTTNYPASNTICKTFSEVRIPHTWNDRPVQRINEGEGFHLGKGWYKKSFNSMPGWQNKRIFIRFDAVGTQAIVKLNDKIIGKHNGPYSAFCYEITDFVEPGKNMLEVEVSNLANYDMTPSESRLQTSFGGIYRPVNILVSENTCISPLDFASSGIYLTPNNVSIKGADLNIQIKTSSISSKSNVEAKAILRDNNGRVVKTIKRIVFIPIGESQIDLNTHVENPHLWDGVRDPYMYSVETTLTSSEGLLFDKVVQPLGFRYFSFSPKEGLTLNGQYYDVYGTSRWQDWENEGFAISTKHDSIDIDLMEELGCTGARFGHYQQDETILNLTDTKGIVSMAELSLIPPNSKTEAFHASCRQQLTELIKQLYNHPSIIVWNLLNEIYPSEERVRDLHELAHSLDSIRPTSVVYNQPIKPEQKGWYNVADIVCSNKYPWWYAKSSDDFGNAGVFAERLEDIRSVRPDVVYGVTEYGAGGCVTQHQQNPKAPEDTKYGRFFPEEYQSLTHEKQWNLLAGHKEYWCKLVWNLADFTWSTASRGDMIGRNHKGLVTHDRKVKKDAFFFYKANWNKKLPTLYITSRRHVEREDMITPVKIYSNCKDVELFVNGESQGKQNNQTHATFNWSNIKLKKGTNTIRVEGMFKGALQVDECKWTLL